MSSVSAFLIKRPNSNNLHPITIRIIKDRKVSYIYIGQVIKKSQWDNKNNCVKNTHLDFLEINQLILDRLSKANKSLISAELKDEYLSSHDIKSKIVSTETNDFFSVSKLHLEKIKNREQFHQFDIEKKRLEVFKLFLDKDKVFFNELDVDILKKFENFLITKRGLALRTVANYMITIRTVCNLALLKSIVKERFYPFGAGKYQIKFPETKKIGLNIKEIKILEDIEGLTEAQERALKAWLLSFYFAGIRFSDVIMLKWKDFIDNRLNYRMGKNNKLVSLKIPQKVFKILNSLDKNDKSVFLFNELEGVNLKDKKRLKTRIKTVNRNFNRRLEIVASKAGIDKKLTMHIARHSFGNISGNKIPIQMLQKLYRHSSVTTTVLYQSNFIQEDMDDALDKVVEF